MAQGTARTGPGSWLCCPDVAVRKYAGPAVGADLTKVPGGAPLALLLVCPCMCAAPGFGGDILCWLQLGCACCAMPMEAEEEDEGEVDMRGVSRLAVVRKAGAGCTCNSKRCKGCL